MYITSMEFKTVDELAQELCDAFVGGGDSIILCDREVARRLLKRFLQFNEDTIACNVELRDYGMDDYCDEYVVSIISNEIFVSKARYNGEPYVLSDNKLVFVQEGFVKEDFIQEKYLGDFVVTFSFKN